MKIVFLVVCILLQLSQARGEEASSDKTQTSAETTEGHSELRVKRAMDMRRLARGIQMLRLGKRSLPLLRLGRSFPEETLTLQDLLASVNFPFYQEDFPVYDEPIHSRYRRSADTSPEQPSPSSAVKRSVDFLPEPLEEDEGYFAEPDSDLIEKRPMNMLRLGKRPMNMLRLGKRPMNMLRLGKRPMNMLRLGKRPMSMLRLGKRPMNMLRLGKREDDGEELMDDDVYEPFIEVEEEASAVKRPMNMLRLGKRPMNMLRLGKRPMNMLRLGKRPMNMLRLGKRPMNMLRLGKREAE